MPIANALLSASLALTIAAGNACAQTAQAAEPEQRAEASAKPFQAFGVGDDVPPLNADNELEWLMGDTHDEWEDDNIYVLDFWATWCGPCIRAMPHIIETQDKYEDDNVHVIGVHIWANDSSPTVEEFVSQRQSQMNFNYDMVQETGDWAAKTYMQATGSSGIPTIMIVNREGQLAWIGHPMEMDEPLAQIVAGEYDLKAAIEADATRREAAAREMRMQEILASPEALEIQTRLRDALNQQDYAEGTALFGELIDLDPDVLSRFRLNQYNIAAVQLEDADRAREIAEAFLASPAAQDPALLNQFAWMIAGTDNDIIDNGIDHTDISISAAERAAEITEHEDADILDTLARTYFVADRLQDALDTQRKAVDMLSEDLPGDARRQFQQRLNQYQAAVAEQAS